MPEPYRLTIDGRKLRALIDRTRTPTDPQFIGKIGQAIRQWGALVQARAVRNVSGFPVIYQGGGFRVMVRTGTLKGAIELQYPFGSPFQARVYVNGTHTSPGGGGPSTGGWLAKPRPVSDYAGSIEWGHPAIDLKQHMQGKTVPFFASRGQNSRGPYTARGLKASDTNAQGYGSGWVNEALNAKLAAKGKASMIFTKRGGATAFKGNSSTYFLTFRRVGKTGWVIPAARPRPFMRAALEGTKDQGRRMMVAAAVDAMGLTEAIQR